MSDDARPARADVPGRAFLVVAICSVLAAAGLFLLATIGGDDVPDATLSVTPATGPAIPDTVPPLAPTVTVPAGVPSTVTEATTGPAGTTAPGSPLADGLGARGSAIIEPPAPRLLPQSITIDELGLWGPVRGVGLDDDGELEVPDETEVGWYELGASPGQEGATVLAAHVTWNDTVGPFHRLGDLDPGAEVRLRLADDSVRIYEVVERAMYPKDGLPNWRIFRRTGPESLVLITCGGSFNPDIRRYRDNIVVYAVPVGSEPAA